MKITIEKNEIVFSTNIFEILDELDEDSAYLLLESTAHSEIIRRELKNAIKHTFSRKNYNPWIFDVRNDLLTNDMIPPMARQHIGSLLSEIAKVKAELERTDRDYYDLYHYVMSLPRELREDMPTRRKYKHGKVSKEDLKYHKDRITELLAEGYSEDD